MMSIKPTSSTLPLTGGCQCGAVRYTVTMMPQGVHFCHCRMCQRALGNVFAALAPVQRDQLRWTEDEPAMFASSTVARRAYCRHCGTPLSFGYNESPWVCLTVGSFDHPEQLPPTVECGIESRLPFLHAREGCEQTTTAGQYIQGMINQQAPPPDGDD